MASISKRDSRFRVIWATYENGKRKQRVRTFANEKQAKAFRAAKEAEEVRGVSGVRMPLGEHLSEWLEAKRSLEATTRAGYARWISHVKRHGITRLPLDRVTARDLDSLYAFLTKEPGGKGKPLSAQSVRHVHTLLGNVFNDAVRHKLLPDNPCLSAKPPKLGKRRVTAPSADQVSLFLADLEQNNPAMLTLACLIAGTGLRRGEALGLRWCDVDFASGRMTVAQVVVEVSGEFFIRKGAKTEASLRTVALAPSILDLLQRQRARVAELRLRLGRHWQDLDLVFPDPASGGPICPAAATRAFRRAADRAGWPKGAAAVHGLRHASASIALGAGVNIATISGRLGHANVAITARLYLHPQEELDAAAAASIADRIGMPKARRS